MLASLLKGILETLGREGWQKLLCICICELFSVYRCVAVGHSECPSIAAGVDLPDLGKSLIIALCLNSLILPHQQNKY